MNKIKRINNKVKKPSEFRMNCKKFFLTYPKKDGIKDVTKSQIIEKLKENFRNLASNPTYILVAEETGKENNDSKDYKHFHVVVVFDRRTDIRDSNFFDIDGVHGHYKMIDKKRGSLSKVQRYCRKNGDYEVWENTLLTTKEVTQLDSTKQTNVAKLVTHLSNLSPTERKHLKLSEASEVLYALNKHRIDQAVNIIINNINNSGKHAGSNYDMRQFHIPQEVEKWKKEYKHQKSLLLLGLSGTGKTSLAKSLFKNPLLVCNKEDLKLLTNDHDGLIFDDFAMAEMNRKEQIHLLDLENARSFLVKFSSIRIPEALPRVFTSNDDEKAFFGVVEGEMLPKELTRRRIKCVVTKDLRKSKSK